MGHFTPSAKLGGDAIRAMMLGPVPKNQALASVVIDKTIELIATILMMSLGLFITLVRIRMAATQAHRFPVVDRADRRSDLRVFPQAEEGALHLDPGYH